MSEVASGMLTLGGWWGMEWRAKVRVQNEGRARVMAQEPALKGCAGSLMVKWSKTNNVNIWATKQTVQRSASAKSIIEAFFITVKPPLLKLASSRLSKV